jgi:hypothetical protein
VEKKEQKCCRKIEKEEKRDENAAKSCVKLKKKENAAEK